MASMRVGLSRPKASHATEPSGCIKNLPPVRGPFCPASSGVDRLPDQWPVAGVSRARTSASSPRFGSASRRLAQGNVGFGESMPLISKLPSGDTATPAGAVLLRPQGEADRQLRVASTFSPASTPLGAIAAASVGGDVPGHGQPCQDRCRCGGFFRRRGVLSQRHLERSRAWPLNTSGTLHICAPLS